MEEETKSPLSITESLRGLGESEIGIIQILEKGVAAKKLSEV